MVSVIVVVVHIVFLFSKRDVCATFDIFVHSVKQR